MFLTAGTQLPFDRMLEWLDQILMQSPEYCVEVKAQAIKGVYQPSNYTVEEFLNTHDFGSAFRDSDFVISHAGMGNIITAIELNVPIIVVPRIAKFKEHRNDHQLDTLKKFAQLSLVYPAYNYTDFERACSELMSGRRGTHEEYENSDSRIALMNFIASFIDRKK